MTVTHSQKQCFSYVRFSSRKQANGNSQDRQLEIAPRVAKEKGWTLSEKLNAQDLGVSAFKGDNIKTLKAIIEATKTGKIPQGTVMIVEAFDRFSRADVDIAEDVLKDMLRAGLEVYVDRGAHHLTKESLTKPIDRIIALLELAQANEYSARLSFRVSEAWKQKKAHAAEHVIMTKMTPAWLIADRKANKWMQDDAKTLTVKRIFQSYADGKGIRTIVRELNQDGVPPFAKGKQSESGLWSATHLRRVLSSRSVLGEYQRHNCVTGKRVPEGEPIADYYPAVIEPELFYRVKELLSQTRVGKDGKELKGFTSGPKTNATNLFTGLAKCARCGSPMHVKRSGLQQGKYFYVSLVCSSATKGGGCEYHTLQLPYVERAVLTLLWSKVVPSLAERDDRPNKLQALQGEFKSVGEQIKKWMGMIDGMEAPPANAMLRLNALETKQAALKRQIESLTATIKNNPLEAWQQVPMTVENRLRLQAILLNEIEALTIDAGKRTAKLTLKEPQCSFDIAWESKAANHVKKDPASEGFRSSAFDGGESPYLDDVLVWQSPRNIHLEICETKSSKRGANSAMASLAS